MVIADTVNKQVYEIIKAMILAKKLYPGERIDPKLIAKENNISLMPVRSALQQLAAQGLVTVVPRVGFFVSKFSNIELQQINDTRKMFELYCIQNYFGNINKNEAAHLMSRIEQTAHDNMKAVQVLDAKLHTMIVEASRNVFLLNQYDNLSCLFNLSMGPFSAETPDIAKEEHLAILDAICKGDSDRAYKCLLQHLSRVGAELIAQNSILGNICEFQP